MAGKLGYTSHARKRMQQRGITEEEIVECIQDYQIQHTDKKGNPVFKATISNGRHLKVVLQKENPRKVITVGD